MSMHRYSVCLFTLQHSCFLFVTHLFFSFFHLVMRPRLGLYLCSSCFGTNVQSYATLSGLFFPPLGVDWLYRSFFKKTVFALLVFLYWFLIFSFIDFCCNFSCFLRISVTYFFCLSKMETSINFLCWISGNISFNYVCWFFCLLIILVWDSWVFNSPSNSRLSYWVLSFVIGCSAVKHMQIKDCCALA